MSPFELNKIVAGILVAAILVNIIGYITDALYEPNLNPKPGYNVAVTEEDVAAQHTQPQKPDIDIKALMQTASAEAGKKLITKCIACHTYDKGGANRVGPNLWNVVGRVKGTGEGFAYSAAMKNAGGTWDYQSLAEFLYKPNAFIKGTKMSFAGISKPQDIADLIAFLRLQSDDPQPLP